MLRIGQVEATATQDGKYTDGSVAGGIAATRLRAAAFNAMQEGLAHIVESAGLALDINDMTQVLKAIQKLTLSRANLRTTTGFLFVVRRLRSRDTSSAAAPRPGRSKYRL